MIRKIIKIDEDLCTGCGECITGCAEGALALVNGKAKLVKEQFCDGFGDCIGTCPTGALTIEERESDEYDEESVKVHIMNERGEEGLKKFMEAGTAHAAKSQPPSGGCPGMREQSFKRDAAPVTATPLSAAPVGQVVRSEIEQWPVMLHLVQPGAAFFKEKELVILSTCSPVSCPDVNWRYVRGRGVVIACPKLDKTEGYVEKLAGIFREAQVPKVVVVRMEVPCCGGLTRMVMMAREMSGRPDLPVEDVVVDLKGNIKEVHDL